MVVALERSPGPWVPSIFGGAHNLAKVARPTYASGTRERPTPVGGTGTSIVQGYLSDVDHNIDLRGPKWTGEYGGIGIGGKMLRDPHVRMSLAYVFNPLLAATWRFKAASKEPVDREIADAATWAFIERLTWRQILRMLVRDYGAYGFALREITDDVLPFPSSRFPNHPGGGKGIIPTGILDLPANTITRWWQSSKDPRKLEKVEQYSPASDVEPMGTREVPADRVLRISYEQEGAAFTGFPILRSAYAPWKAKIALQTIRMIKHERFGAGELVATAADGATDDELDAVELILAQWRAHAKSYAVFPFGWDVKPAGMTQNDGTNIDQAIASCDIDIAVNVACGFQMLGVKSTSGTYGLGETQQGAYHLAEVGHAGLVCDAFNIGFDDWSPVRRFVDLNYGPQYPTPQLQALYLPTRDWHEVIKALVAAAQQRLITPDEPLEDEIREMAQVGQRDEATERKPEPIAIGSSKPPPPSGDTVEGADAAVDPATVTAEETPDATTPKELQTIFSYHLQYGVAKINEARANLNLPPVPYGDQSVPEFLASLMSRPQDPAQSEPTTDTEPEPTEEDEDADEE